VNYHLRLVSYGSFSAFLDTTDTERNLRRALRFR